MLRPACAPTHQESVPVPRRSPFVTVDLIHRELVSAAAAREFLEQHGELPESQRRRAPNVKGATRRTRGPVGELSAFLPAKRQAAT